MTSKEDRLEGMPLIHGVIKEGEGITEENMGSLADDERILYIDPLGDDDLINRVSLARGDSKQPSDGYNPLKELTD